MDLKHIFTNPATLLGLVFETPRLKFKTDGNFPLSNENELRLFVDDLETLSGLSVVPNQTSKVVIGLKKAGINFYLVEEVNHDHFIGSRLDTHLNFILSSTEIAYLRGYLFALASKELSC